MATRVRDILQKFIFNIWYLGDPPWDTGISPPELIHYIETHPPGKALDMGCGTGTNAITLAKSGWDVIGIDFSPIAIYQGRRKAKRAGVKINFRIGDVSQPTGISDKFDLVLDIGCYHSLSDHKKQGYRDKIEAFLKDKGTLLMYVFFKEPGESGTGLLESEINLFSPALKLMQRVDGYERGRRQSAWLWLTRRNETN